MRIYLSAPHISGREQALVQEAFDTNWIAPVGPHIDAFEREFAASVGVPCACALASGTAGLHLALILAGVKPGDAVAVSTFTFVATANPILYCGATPVLVDSESESWGMDPARLEDVLARARESGRSIKAVIVVHLYGHPARITEIAALCKRYNAVLIEDAAESLGSLIEGRSTGTFGDFGVFSFNGNKIITTSGGGMLVARNPEHVERARFLATQAKDPGGYYRHSTLGFNYRMSNVGAAIGRGQLEQLEQKVARRREIADRYEAELGSLPGVGFLRESRGTRANRWLTTITLEPGVARTDRDTLVAALERENIECRPVWHPLHRQKLYQNFRYSGGDVAATLASRALNLPSGSGMTDAQQSRVLAALKQALG
jgi:pyridoxal phosphate-dependent aminotransferase EpsN